MDLIPDRYAHNPMFVLVENFVLDAIGKLEPDKAARLAEIINRTFGGSEGGDWRATFRDYLALPPDTQASLQTLWQQRQTEADLKQEDLSPEIFARDMADQLFSDLGGT